MKKIVDYKGLDLLPKSNARENNLRPKLIYKNEERTDNRRNKKRRYY